MCIVVLVGKNYIPHGKNHIPILYLLEGMSEVLKCLETCAGRGIAPNYFETWLNASNKKDWWKSHTSTKNVFSLLIEDHLFVSDSVFIFDSIFIFYSILYSYLILYPYLILFSYLYRHSYHAYI